MKKMLISMLFMACTVLAAAAAVNEEGGSNNPGSIESVSKGVEKFDTIYVDVPSCVKVYKGDAYDVRIISDSEYAGVECRIENGKLVISSKYDYESLRDVNVRIRVVTPDDSVKVEAGKHCELAVM